MGKAAKMYKRPSLKEKQRKQRSTASAASASTPSAASSSKGKAKSDQVTADLQELKRLARKEKATIEALKEREIPRREKPAADTKRAPVSLGQGIEQSEDEEDADASHSESEQAETDKPKRTRRSGRAGKRFKVPEGEARTPREAGIDYLAQWEGKKNFRN